jgi:hypothetical protein
VSRPLSDPAHVLVGHGVGATPPQSLGTALLRHAWLDATMSVTTLAPRGAAFADEAAVRAWANRAWQELSVPGDVAPAPRPVVWRAGRGAAAVVGVTWPDDEVAAMPAALRSLAPLWAGVLARAMLAEPGASVDGPWRLVVAEGRALTLIDMADGAPATWATLALARNDAALLAQAQARAPGPVWVAGHSLPGDCPTGVRVLPGLGTPSQTPAALLALLQSAERAEPALRHAPLIATRLGAALLATALAVLLLAGLSAWESHSAWEAARARAEARARLAEAERRQVQDARARQAAARQRLEQPWALRWAAAEAAQPAGGGWLRLEQRRDAGTLLLAGEAESPSDALAVSRRIAAVPGVAEALLLRSEVTGGAGAGSRARFELGVRLVEARP